MKKLFVAIRQNDFDTVKSIVEKDASVLTKVSVGAPKKDEGQSPLQVALKSSSTKIVNYLLDKGANVNFIETDTKNSWQCPAIHDAINRAIMCSRWNVNRSEGLEVMSTKDSADEAYEILERMISLGASVNSLDSYGNSCIDRACLQARQILPTSLTDTDRVLTKELREDVSRVFNLLITNNADLNYVNPNSNKTCIDSYSDEPLGEFLIK